MALVLVLGEPRLDLRVAPRFLLPFGQWLGLEAARADVCGDVTPRFGERGEAARRNRLNKRISDDGGFSWACQDGFLRRVRRRLVEILILAASADDLQAARRLTDDGFDCADDR